MHGAVVPLSRWEVMGEIIKFSAPAIHQTEFHYAGKQITLEIKPEYGVDAVYAHIGL